MSTAGCEPGATGRVKVLLWCLCGNDANLAEIEREFDRTGELLRGTPGLLGSELLVSLSAPGVCAVLSEWASHAEFDAWERGRGHHGQTAGMRPFQDHQRDPVFEVLFVSRTHDARTGVVRSAEEVGMKGVIEASVEDACLGDE